MSGYPRFLTLFDEIDALLRVRMGRTKRRMAHPELLDHFSRSDVTIRSNLTLMREMANVRNLVQHNSPWFPFVVPNDAAVNLYERIYRRLSTPCTAFSISVPASKVFTASLDSSIVDTMKVMARKGYSQAPVLEDGVVDGVFSESTPLSIVEATGEFLVTRGDVLRDIRKHLGLQRAVNEHFLFVRKEAALDELVALFDSNRREEKRIGAVFVTASGHKRDPLLGLITAWDVAAAQTDV